MSFFNSKEHTMMEKHMLDQPVVQLPSTEERLLVRAEFANLSPAELFDYWVQPELICQWWPQMAEIEAHVGGSYRLSWPQMGWILDGRVTACIPGELLAFTWKWLHETEVPERHVSVTLAPRSSGGSTLIVEHSTYSVADQAERQGHLEGWLHFLTQLFARQV
jgi:uncharacterized protein YndB with AHSA1/START domain